MGGICLDVTIDQCDLEVIEAKEIQFGMAFGQGF
jgi:hypothetical protein